MPRNIASEVCMSIVILFFLFSFFDLCFEWHDWFYYSHGGEKLISCIVGLCGDGHYYYNHHSGNDTFIWSFKVSPLFVKGTFLSHVIHFHVVNTDGDRHFRHFWGIFPTLMVIVAAHMANWHY